MRGWRFLLPVSVSFFVLLAALLVMYTSPQLSYATHTAPGAWVEDPAITGCNHCHNVTIKNGNANTTNRKIALSPSQGSTQTGNRRNDWTSTVTYMISKGCPATTAATSYLNTCYCTTCTNPNPEGTSCTAVADTPPTMPTNVTAVSDGSGTTINLSWTASTDDVGVVSYNIYRDANPTPVGSSASTSFADTGLTPSTPYSYEVEAVDTIGQKSAKSTPVVATTTVDTTPPSQPTGVSCTPDASGTRVTLTWTASTDDFVVAGYNIYRDLNAIPTGSSPTTSFTDQGLTSNTTYTYEVEAEDGAGNLSPKSSSIQCTTLEAVVVNQLWVARYNGPASTWDAAYSLKTDSAGNVYVTGESAGTTSDYDYATIKYDADGNQLWASRYNGPGNGMDSASAMVVDGSGNVYVTGWSSGTGTDLDYATVKYDSNGSQLWAARYNGPGNLVDFAKAIAVDGSGNVYVTGASMGVGLGYDYATVKYDSSGTQLWAVRYNATGGLDIAADLALDGSGNVIVTGHSFGSSNEDYATVKYDSNGTQLWVARYNGAGNSWDEATALGVDGSNNIFVTGSSYNGTSYDYVTLKYDPAGTQSWASTYNGTGNGYDYPWSLLVSSGGGVVVTGESFGSTGKNDVVTVKYDTSGTQLWSSTHTGYGNSRGRAMAEDTSGNIYVGGYSYGALTSSDYITLKLDSNGNETWSVIYNGPGNGVDKAFDVDASGNVYISGYSYDANTGYDYATIKYAQMPVPAEQAISQAAGDQRFPWADYNAAAGEYLVAWQDKRNGNDDIYAARLDQNGNLISGSEIAVSTAAGHQQRVLVKAGGGGYLVVWHDLRNQATNGADIYGAWINANGTVGQTMALCACSQDQWNPVAGYDPVSNTFLVVFLDARGSVNNQSGNPNDNYDLWGVIVPAGGSPSLTAFPLIQAANGQRGPELGYDYENHRYYLAWNDRRNGGTYDIYGSRVSTGGMVLDNPGVFVTVANGNQFRPTVMDRRPAQGLDNFFLAWTDFRNGSQGDVYGAFVDVGGNPVSEFPISLDSSDQANVVGAVDWLNSKRYLMSYIKQYSGTNYDVYRALVEQNSTFVSENPVVGEPTGAADDQRANAAVFASNGTTSYGFLIVWMDKRTGTSYDIYATKVWP